MVVLLAVVAAAASGVAVGDAGAGTSSVTRVSTATSDVLNIFVAAAWGVAAVVLVFVVTHLSRRPQDEPDEPEHEVIRKTWWLPSIALLAIIASVAIPIALIRANRTDGAGPGTLGGSSAASGASTGSSTGGPPTPSAWTLLAVAAGAAAAGIVLFGGKHRPSEAEGELRHGELVRAVDETIESIEREPDPRRAIIRAYVRMERALTQSGLPRRPSETPLEYVEEALQELMVPLVPTRSLTDLFEIARFSRRPLDAAMKRRAIEDLLAVRQALAAEAS